MEKNIGGGQKQKGSYTGITMGDPKLLVSGGCLLDIKAAA
jgi:hypothetical protein